MSQEPPDEDGQLHTLGLLEQLRSESQALWGASSEAYFKVEKLLRALANPNLHDITNLTYRVELWDKYAVHIRWTVAAIGHISIAQAAFDEAVKAWPGQRLTLRQGIRVIREHPVTKIAGRESA
jgi:hypothetical protein